MQRLKVRKVGAWNEKTPNRKYLRWRLGWVLSVGNVSLSMFFPSCFTVQKLGNCTSPSPLPGMFCTHFKFYQWVEFTWNLASERVTGAIPSCPLEVMVVVIRQLEPWYLVCLRPTEDHLWDLQQLSVGPWLGAISALNSNSKPESYSGPQSFPLSGCREFHKDLIPSNQSLPARPTKVVSTVLSKPINVWV